MMNTGAQQEHGAPTLPAVPVVHGTLETLIEELQKIERATLRGLRLTTRFFRVRDSAGVDCFTIRVIVSALTVQEGVVQVLFWSWLAGQFTEFDGSPWGTPTRGAVVGWAEQAQRQVVRALREKLPWRTVGEGVYYLGAEALRPIGTTELIKRSEQNSASG